MGSPAVAPAASPPQGRYRKLLDLATGGMGRVELALAQGEGNFARVVALKRLHAPFEDDEQFRAMFFDEARLAGLVHHPNVGAVLDVGRDEVGYYLAMEYVEGQTVAALIMRVRERGETLPVQLATKIVAAVARGLSAAHELRSLTGEQLDLVHRDVSPQNILIGYDGAVKVVDFGVARAAGRMQSTVGTALKGKLGYMSPEQLSFQQPDARSDLFGLGVVLYEMLVLHRLYRSDDGVDGPRRILNEPPPRLRDARPGVPPKLDALVTRLLAKKPDDRPRTAAEVAIELEAVAASLALREGPIDIGVFLKARFEAEAAERRAAIRRAIEPATSGAQTTSSSSASIPLPPEAAASASVSLVRPTRPTPATPVGRYLGMAALVMVAIVGGGVLAIFTTDDPAASPPTRPPPTSSASPSPAPSAAPRPPPAAPVPPPVTAQVASPTTPALAPPPPVQEPPPSPPSAAEPAAPGPPGAPQRPVPAVGATGPIAPASSAPAPAVPGSAAARPEPTRPAARPVATTPARPTTPRTPTPRPARPGRPRIWDWP